MYVASSDGKKINPGSAAELTAGNRAARRTRLCEGQGQLYVGLPGNAQALLATLGSEELVKELASVSAPFEVGFASTIEMASRSGPAPRTMPRQFGPARYAPAR
jgi:hypothetical protein